MSCIFTWDPLLVSATPTHSSGTAVLSSSLMPHPVSLGVGGGGDIYGDGDFLQLTMHGILLDMGAFGFHVKDPRAVEKEVSM